MPVEKRVARIAESSPKGKLSIRRKTKLLSLNRSRLYYKRRAASQMEMKLMDELQKQYEKMPFFGYRRHKEVLVMVKISMDGKGRCLDNIWIERFWKTIKYEEVYLNTYDSVLEAEIAISKYILWYNNERPHQSLRYKTPQEVYDQALNTRPENELVNSKTLPCSQLTTESNSIVTKFSSGFFS